MKLRRSANLEMLCPHGRLTANGSIFFSDRSGRGEIWKIPASGGAAVQVTQHGGFECFPSPDGKFLY